MQMYAWCLQEEFFCHLKEVIKMSVEYKCTAAENFILSVLSSRNSL